MGNRNSRINSIEGQGESIPIKIRSTIIGRFEEFRKYRNAESTLSKKQLLKNGEEEDGGSNVSRPSSHETNETQDCKVSVSTKEETKVPITITKEKININNEIDVSKDKEIHVNVKDEAKVKTREENIERIVEEVKKEQEVSAKSDEDDDNDRDGDDDEEIEDLGRYLCPGSPSFRIYCIEANERKEREEEEDEEFKSPPTAVLQKSRSDNCLDNSASRNTRTSNEVVENVASTKRKGHMMRRFGAVRKLLKVKSCYHPICTCTGDERRSQLISAKATN